jgi:hypothetical protein
MLDFGDMALRFGNNGIGRMGRDALEVTACGPFDALEVGELIIAQRVQARSEWDAAAGRGAVWVLVVGIERSMEVLNMVSIMSIMSFCATYEIFLHVNKRDVVVREELSNASSVGVLVTRNLVAIENRRKTSDVESDGVELARGLGKHRAQERKLEQDGAAHVDD